MDLVTLRARIASVCGGDPFQFVQAQTPFSFEKQPTSNVDKVFRLEATMGSVVGGMSFTEDHVDYVSIWVARKLTTTPEETYQALLTDVTSLRSAVIRDGIVTSGEYSVPDEGEMEISTQPGQEYAVLRYTLPVQYEASV